jgi:hypothetical protein
VERIYDYNERKYLFKIVIPVGLAILFSIISLYRYYFVSKSGLYMSVFIICFLISTDHLIGLSHPKKIVNSSKSIEFYSFGRRHMYRWKDVKNINIREFPFSKKVYVRMNNASFSKGRYWVSLDYMDDSEELIKDLKMEEASRHKLLKNFNKRSTRRK